jgi:hypothetical protein
MTIQTAGYTRSSPSKTRNSTETSSYALARFSQYGIVSPLVRMERVPNVFAISSLWLMENREEFSTIS